VLRPPIETTAVIGEVLYKGMSRDISFRRLGADPFLSRHSAQLVEGALPLREWSCSGLRSCFVSVSEAEERFLFAVVPYPGCGGAIRLLKHQA
jgi:hypothetical protein